MKVRDFLLALLALSSATMAITIATPGVAADSFNVTADQPVHALGEQVTMTVSYTGGVHGDVKLSIEDSSGNVVNQWTWSHPSSDPFQQSVSYSPANAGTYVIKALHQPHHMEPPSSAYAQVAFWSARILNLEYNNKVDAGKPVDIKATVSYYFTEPTQVKLEIWSNSENKNLGTLMETMNGQGTTALTLRNMVFSSVQSQDVTARISYQSPKASWINDTTGGTYTAKVTVVPEFAVTPALILSLTLVSIALLRKQTTRKAQR
jgi:hypothetical protein